MYDNVIIIKKKFLSKKECCELIDFYNKNTDKWLVHRDTIPMILDTSLDVTKRIEEICYFQNPSCILDTQHLVKWPKGSKMKPHVDSQGDVFACLVYLNDDYEGGETCFLDENGLEQKIKPEVGKLFIFSNDKILHWVNEVTDKTRYTLALWFVSK